ncbi:MAG: NAD(P)-dependent glycerol-3-phosphate dehydrogenase [Lactobacillaceae bacterium]|jgi:glycerol-3-phosphate dehydrogenase (NAD(P)+)|nr:NAD(P)-dependent glycerol-3-phosphate dehydrogenase [Lactobacillaceae bacterium]
MTNKVAILGTGSWGTALASTFAENQNNDVIIWGISSDQIDDININHQNKKYLGDSKLSPNLKATADMASAVVNANIILFVVPTKAIYDVAGKLNNVLIQLQNSQNHNQDQQQKIIPIIGHATKGIEANTFKRISQMINEATFESLGALHIKEEDLFFLAGPSHAESVVAHAITLVSIASPNQQNAKFVQQALANKNFRVYTNTDIVGSELAASLKNVLAIAGGIIKGLNMVDNTQAALVTRGLVEMKRFGVAMGGQNTTFDGLAGLGDLIVTAMSPNSRNFRAGLQLAQGKTLEEIQTEMGMVIEGIANTKAIYDLSQEKNINMPISTSVYNILYKGQKVEEAIDELMARKLTSE